jgi:hypothetical protein
VVVHRVADRPLATGGRQAAVHQHDHPLGQPFHLVEHVRADDHRAAVRTELLEQRDEVQSLHRVGPVERLVEHEHVGVGDERRGDLGPLTHALAERADLSIGDVEQIDGAQCPVGCVRSVTRRRSAM